MKRFHVHVSVPDLQAGIEFYSKLFAATPSVQREDYAKWMLEDPRMNFAISHRGHAAGVNHLGFQTDSGEELQAMRSQLKAADAALVEQSDQGCCYARSDKYWVTDTAGIAWETFHTLSTLPVYGEDTGLPVAASAACCVPAKVEEMAKGSCCTKTATQDAAPKATSCCA
jgi:lactoylglutathione lyase